MTFSEFWKNVVFQRSSLPIVLGSLAILCGIVASIVSAISVYHVLRSSEYSSWQTQFQVLCQQRENALTAFVGFSIDAINDVGAFGYTSVVLQNDSNITLSQTHFQDFLYNSNVPQWLNTITWMPYVTNSSRAHWENETGLVIVGNNFTQLINHLPILLPVPNDFPFYFPYQYLYPATVFCTWVLGFNGLLLIGGGSGLVDAVMQGSHSFGERVPLKVTDICLIESPLLGIPVTLPVYSPPIALQHITYPETLTPVVHSGFDQLIGLAQSVINIVALMEAAVTTIDDAPIQLDLYDLTTTNPNKSFIATVNPVGEGNTATSINANSVFANMSYGNRNYTLFCSPSDDYIQSAYSSTPALVAGGIGIAGFLYVMIIFSIFFAIRFSYESNRRFELQEIVKKRTEALAFLENSRKIAEASNAAKSAFLAFLCHELRNPLHAVGAMMNFLQASPMMTTLTTEYRTLRPSMVSFQWHSEDGQEEKVVAGKQSTHSTAHSTSNSLEEDLETSSTSSQSTLTPTAFELECLETINFQVRMMNTLVNDALDMSKIEAGKLQLEWRSFAWKDFIRRSVLACKAKAKNLQIHLTLVFQLDLTHTPDRVIGDSNRFSQIIANLISNALKFTPPNGKVQIILRLCSREAIETLVNHPVLDEDPSVVNTKLSTVVNMTPLASSEFVDLKIVESISQNRVLFLEIVVRDTGSGISSEGLSKLFIPFSQANLSVARTHGGTGLGLSICKQILTIMGGAIGVWSSPSQGSSFVVRVPFILVDDTSQQISHLIEESHSYSDNINPTEPLRDSRFGEHDRPSSSMDHKIEVQMDLIPSSSLNAEAKGLDTLKGPIESTLTAPIKNLRQTLASHCTSFLAASPSDLSFLLSRIRDSSQSPKQIQILAVDDSQINLKILGRMLDLHDVAVALSAHDAIVALTNSLREALPSTLAIPQAVFHMLLTDISMPEVDGVELARIIRDVESAHCIPKAFQLPILAVSASALSHERAVYESAGINFFIAKPFNKRQIRDMIDLIIQQQVHMMSEYLEQLA